jgi:hypothetical protein
MRVDEHERANAFTRLFEAARHFQRDESANAVAA